MNRTAGVVLLGLVLVAGFAAAQMKVDHLRAHDFSEDRTVASMPGTAAHTAMIQDRVELAVRSRLEAAGLRFLDRGRPDLYVQTHAITNLETQAQAVNAGLGIEQQDRFRSPGSGANVERTKTHPVGTLVIELLEADTGRVVWQAVGRGVLDGEADAIETKLGKAFESFPPKPRKKRRR